jgi:hypothetical protein
VGDCIEPLRERERVGAIPRECVCIFECAAPAKVPRPNPIPLSHTPPSPPPPPSPPHPSQVCQAFLDNRRRLKSVPQDPRALAQGVLNISDYWLLRPDVSARQEMAGAETLKPSACRRASKWEAMTEEEVAGKVEKMLQRLQEEHVQLNMDGIRNIWIVKPGHGSRGRGIKVSDDLQVDPSPHSTPPTPYPLVPTLHP